MLALSVSVSAGSARRNLRRLSEGVRDKETDPAKLHAKTVSDPAQDSSRVLLLQQLSCVSHIPRSQALASLLPPVVAWRLHLSEHSERASESNSPCSKSGPLHTYSRHAGAKNNHEQRSPLDALARPDPVCLVDRVDEAGSGGQGGAQSGALSVLEQYWPTGCGSYYGFSDSRCADRPRLSYSEQEGFRLSGITTALKFNWIDATPTVASTFT